MITVEDAILACRVRRPYFSVALMAMTPIPNKTIKTLAVDKWWRLYYNQDFLDTLTTDEAAAVIEHEVSHLLRKHSGRYDASLADPTTWNVAADLEINDDICDLPKMCLHPKKFGFDDGLLAEEYLDLIKDSKPSGMCSGGSGAGEPIDGELDGPSTAAGSTPGISEAEAEKVISKVAADVMADPGAGAGWKIWADAKIIKPRRISLKEAISMSMSSSRGASKLRSWTRPSRRQNEFLPKPGVASFSSVQAVLLDCSGSMSSSMDTALSTCIGLFRDNPEVHLYGCDGDTLQRLSPTISGLRAANGGGDIDGAKLLSDLSKRYTKITVITDGFEFWGDKKPRGSVAFILVGSGKAPGWAQHPTVVTPVAS